MTKGYRIIERERKYSRNPEKLSRQHNQPTPMTFSVLFRLFTLFFIIKEPGCRCIDLESALGGARSKLLNQAIHLQIRSKLYWEGT
jgi:hypothetical protein